ncbi:MAG: hypothetical protein RIR09_3051, partial [Pseudomonadota bacterium]
MHTEYEDVRISKWASVNSAPLTHFLVGDTVADVVNP